MEDNSSSILDNRLTTDEFNVSLNTLYNLTTTLTTSVQLNDDLIIENAINRDPFYVVIPITLIYAIILITGIIGNVSTCIVISRNKTMHTATNYYLFSLAVSDFMLLISGAPMELYHIWYKHEFIFGEAFCILRNAINEMSANATVLTITAFTIERYVAICHPFLSHTMSKLSRAIKFIFLIWILSITFAVPQAIQTGIVINEQNEAWCTIVQERVLIEHSFELATILFFFAPMTLITVLYMLIGMKLRSSTLIKRENGNVVRNNNNNIHTNGNTHSNTSQSTKRVLKMLVAVVICFFLSWMPFHLQRLVYIYASYSGNYNSEIIISFFTYTTYISGILYYISTCINPILYNLMSNKFRQAFKETLQKKCCTFSTTDADTQKRQYRMLSRRKRWNVQSEPSEYSGSGKDDYYYSSSTQKQSIETIATPRNTSGKQMSKYYNENFSKSPSIIEMGSTIVSSSRFHNNMNNDNDFSKACNACISKKIAGPEINIIPDTFINEIQLNIFPPSVSYSSKSAPSSSSSSTLPQGKSQANSNGKYVDNNVLSGHCLNIDVYENNNKLHTLSTTSTSENREKSIGNFSHISLKRSDSILHITIGASSKIIKRSKRKRKWFFAKLYKLSRKSKRDNNHEMFLSPESCEKNGIYHLNNMQGLNIANDSLVITINKNKSRDISNSTVENDSRQNTFRILEGDLVYGANELDFYMNEIKKRENR